MPAPPLHVLFSPSAAGTLRQLFAMRRSRDLVVAFHDDFSFGPLAGDDIDRATWIDANFGVADWHEVVVQTRSTLHSSCAQDMKPIVWISRRDARSYAGFLWWLSNRGDARCTIVDVTHATQDGLPMVPGARPAVSPAILSCDAMARLLDTQRALENAERREYLALWQRLRSENASFRTVGADGVLTSAPITCFDPLLLSCAGPDWRRASRIVGEALCRQWDAGFHQVGDIALFACLDRLGEAGVLECRGSTDDDILACEFRLPTAYLPPRSDP